MGEPIGLNREYNLLRVQYEANEMLVRSSTVLGNLIMQCIHLLNLLRGILHQLHMLLVPLGHVAVLCLDGFLQPA